MITSRYPESQICVKVLTGSQMTPITQPYAMMFKPQAASCNHKPSNSWTIMGLLRAEDLR